MSSHPQDLDALGRELSARGVEYAVATVVWRQAPSSGQIGSRAIVTADGTVHGWIGGACAEPTVIREAQRLIRSGEAKLLFLGASEDLVLPEGVTSIPMSCQSEGSLQIYVEPVLAPVHLVVVGHSPMARTLTDLASALGWHTELVAGPDFLAGPVDPRSVVVVATQGHGDEDVLRHAVTAAPVYVGLVASRKRGEAVLGYLAERGVASELLGRVRTPVGLDLGRTTHPEIAVAILAELVRERAAGGFVTDAVAPQQGTAVEGAAGHPAVGHAAAGRPLLPLLETAEAIDPVCGMTVTADAAHYPHDVAGTTYFFCCVGCRDSFADDPERYLAADSPSECCGGA